MAQSKTRQYVQQSIKFKLRRPSTPEDPRRNKTTPSSSDCANSARKIRYVRYLSGGSQLLRRLTDLMVPVVIFHKCSLVPAFRKIYYENGLFTVSVSADNMPFLCNLHRAGLFQ